MVIMVVMVLHPKSTRETVQLTAQKALLSRELGDDRTELSELLESKNHDGLQRLRGERAGRDQTRAPRKFLAARVDDNEIGNVDEAGRSAERSSGSQKSAQREIATCSRTTD